MLYKVLWCDEIGPVGKVGRGKTCNDTDTTVTIKGKDYVFKREQVKTVCYYTEPKKRKKLYYDSNEELLGDALKAQRIIMKLYGINKCITYDMRDFKSNRPIIRKYGRIAGIYDHSDKHITVHINIINKFERLRKTVIMITIYTITHELTHYVQLSGIDLCEHHKFKCKYGSNATELDCNIATIKFLHKNALIISREFSDIFTYKDFEEYLTNKLFTSVLSKYYQHRKSDSINSNSSFDLLLDKMMLNIDSFTSNILNRSGLK